MAKTVPVIFALLSAGLISSGVGIWKVAEPVNTIYNATTAFIHQPAEKNLINASDGNTLVGLGILFAVFTIISLYLSRSGRSRY